MFKVGDEVRRIHGGKNGNIDVGQTFIVKQSCGIFVKDADGCDHDVANLELVINCCDKTNNVVEKKMSNILDFAKNLVLGEDEKLLRKHGFKDSCGDYTLDARHIISDIVCKQNETKLIEIAKAKEAEELKTK